MPESVLDTLDAANMQLDLLWARGDDRPLSSPPDDRQTTGLARRAFTVAGGGWARCEQALARRAARTHSR